jgi:hypothetical protein
MARLLHLDVSLLTSYRELAKTCDLCYRNRSRAFFGSWNLVKIPFDRLREQVETCSLTYKYAFSHICPSSRPAVSGNWSYNFTRCHRLTPVLSWRCTVFWSEQTVHFHTLMFEKPYLLIDSTGIACQASVCSDYLVTGND